MDPLTNKYPWYTPFQFAGNKPIFALDLDGLEELSFNSHMAVGLASGNPLQGVGTFICDWYNDKGEGQINAFGRGLKTVARNLTPLRPADENDPKTY